MSVEQSLPICLTLSAMGGILEVIATALVAYPDARAQEGQPWCKRHIRYALGGNIVLQILASVVGNLFAPWYGPVSIVGPTFFSAQLLANMVIYGTFLGLESFTRDMRVGTYVIAVGAVLLPVVGPTEQENQNAVELITQHPHAMVWSIILLLGMFISAVRLGLGIDKSSSLESYRIAVLLMARSTSFAINLSVSKMMVSEGMNTIWLIVVIVLKILSGAVMTYAIVVQSTAVSQNTFVPLNATTIMLVNGITGIILWEDWRVVSSWLGYACVFCLLVLGNYLLLGEEVELFTVSNRRYGRAFLLQRLAGKRNLNYRPEEFTSKTFENQEGHHPHLHHNCDEDTMDETYFESPHGTMSSSYDDRQMGPPSETHDDGNRVVSFASASPEVIDEQGEEEETKKMSHLHYIPHDIETQSSIINANSSSPDNFDDNKNGVEIYDSSSGVELSCPQSSREDDEAGSVNNVSSTTSPLTPSLQPSPRPAVSSPSAPAGHASSPQLSRARDEGTNHVVSAGEPTAVSSPSRQPLDRRTHFANTYQNHQHRRDSNHHRRGRSARVEAWMSVYGINRSYMELQSHRGIFQR